MLKKHSLLILFLISITWFGCREEQDGVNSPTATVTLEKAGSVQLSFDKTAAANSQMEDVDTVTALLTRSGFESVLKNIAFAEGIATGTIFNVTEGKWHLTIKAKDSTGTTIYSGNTDVEIINDQTTYVSIELSAAATSGNLSINVSWKEGDGINWTVYSGNPVLDIGTSGAWDDVHVGHQAVIYNGINYEMWYVGYDGSNYRIGYATSTDGINWNKYSGNPILNLGASGSWDDYYVTTPTVLYNGVNYEMWYAGYDGTYSHIGYASSPDGINWTKYAGNPVLSRESNLSWESYGITNPTVVFNNTNYEMWYSGSDGTNQRIGYATSKDGINWTKYSGNPVLNIGATDSWDDKYVLTPDVVLDKNSYKMWYAGNDGTAYRIGYATSIDGINWSKYSGNPVVDIGTIGTWEVSRVLSPTVLYNGISYKMWFLGGNSTNERIGYATSQ